MSEEVFNLQKDQISYKFLQVFSNCIIEFLLPEMKECTVKEFDTYIVFYKTIYFLAIGCKTQFYKTAIIFK